jgi:hypothetical protein
MLRPVAISLSKSSWAQLAKVLIEKSKVPRPANLWFFVSTFFRS